MPYGLLMPIALRDMPTWRRALVEHGLSMAWLASRTGKSYQTVQSYSTGRRKAPAEWIAKAESVIAERTAA